MFSINIVLAVIFVVVVVIIITDLSLSSFISNVLYVHTALIRFYSSQLLVFIGFSFSHSVRKTTETALHIRGVIKKITIIFKFSELRMFDFRFLFVPLPVIYTERHKYVNTHTYIHTYIIGHYNPFSENYGLTSHTARVV